MFSGKTEELLRRLRRHVIAGRVVAVVKPAVDDRWKSSEVVSHNGLKMDCIAAENRKDIFNTTREHSVIGIDEVQFFGDDVLSEILTTHLHEDRIIIVAGLDLTFSLKPWPIVAELMCYADKVDKLAAVCVVCGADATRSQRLLDGRPAPFSGPDVLVAGAESYEARCPGCFVAA